MNSQPHTAEACRAHLVYCSPPSLTRVPSACTAARQDASYCISGHWSHEWAVHPVIRLETSLCVALPLWSQLCPLLTLRDSFLLEVALIGRSRRKTNTFLRPYHSLFSVLYSHIRFPPHLVAIVSSRQFLQLTVRGMKPSFFLSFNIFCDVYHVPGTLLGTGASRVYEMWFQCPRSLESNRGSSRELWSPGRCLTQPLGQGKLPRREAI